MKRRFQAGMSRMGASGEGPEEGSTARKPFVVAVEGNIGSGKSTMIDYFKRFADVQAHPEPVDKWTNLKGHNLLEQLYQDPKRASFQMQSYIQLTRLQILKTKMDEGKTVRLIERSVQNNRFCFLELAFNAGSLSVQEFEVLKSWYDWMDKHMSLDLDLIIYLRTRPEVAHSRMLRRGRKEETGSSGPPLEYLIKLHDCYEDWLVKDKFGKLSPKVMVVDANVSTEELHQVYQTIINNVREEAASASGESKENRNVGSNTEISADAGDRRGPLKDC